MIHCLSVDRFTPPALAYGFNRAKTRFSVIVALTGRLGGNAFSGSDELIGVDVATFPGGGETSAVKSEFCSASVFARGAGMMTGLFISMTYALSRNAICRAALERRLSLSAQSPPHAAICSGLTCRG